jgi:DNA repair exonuclease SbcCD ATPase subunit
MTLAELEDRVKSMSYDIKANKALLDRSREELRAVLGNMQVLDQASETLKRIGEQKKKATIEMFERVVTLAVKEVFGFDYRFAIEVSAEKKVLTKFKLIDSKGLELDIMTSCGGGIVDVVSFVLKALMLASIRPKRDPVMFMDERFAHLSREYLPKMAQLLKSLSEQLGIKFVLVTHQPEFLEVATNGYLLGKTPAGTEFKKLV